MAQIKYGRSSVVLDLIEHGWRMYNAYRGNIFYRHSSLKNIVTLTNEGLELRLNETTAASEVVPYGDKTATYRALNWELQTTNHVEAPNENFQEPVEEKPAPVQKPAPKAEPIPATGSGATKTNMTITITHKGETTDRRVWTKGGKLYMKLEGQLIDITDRKDEMKTSN